MSGAAGVSEEEDRVAGEGEEREDGMDAGFVFFSSLRLRRAMSFSIWRRIFSSARLVSICCTSCLKSARSWRMFRVRSFSACASLISLMVCSILALDSLSSCSASSLARSQ